MKFSQQSLARLNNLYMRKQGEEYMRIMILRFYKAVICCCAIVLLMGFSPRIKADDQRACQDFTASITGPLVALNTGDSEGPATIGDQEYHLKAHGEILSVTPQLDGSLYVTFTHALQFYQNDLLVGTMNTTDAGTWKPTTTPGVLTVDEYMVIVSGTDRFATACGKLHFIGALDTVGNVAYGNVTGDVCKCKQ
jgi:hypothetical protein